MKLIEITQPAHDQVFPVPATGGTFPVQVKGTSGYSVTNTPTQVIEKEVFPITVRLGSGTRIEAVMAERELGSTWSATVAAPAGASQVLTIEATITTTRSDRTTGDVLASSSYQATLRRSISVVDCELLPNIQVTHSTGPNNARSESYIAINPNNPMQIVSGSKKFRNIQTYDFTLATQYSDDGGCTWHDSADLALPGFTGLSDPALTWDDAGNVFLAGLSCYNPPNITPIGIEIYKSTDGGRTWSAPNRIHSDSSDDKQWAAGDSSPTSPFHGNIYAVWHNAGNMCFARTKDHGATWVGAGPGVAPAGTIIVNGGAFAPEVNVAANGNIYIVWIDGSEIKMIVSTDGGDSFHPTVSPATGVTILGTVGPHFPGETFRVLTLPTACVFGSTVAVAWADRREGVSRIYYALSIDGGASWSTGPSGKQLLTGALPTNLHHFHPQIVCNPQGVIGCAFYEFGPKPTTPLIDVIMARSVDGGASFSHFTLTDQPWDPAVNAPWARGNPNVTFIGEYFGLDASGIGFYPLWTDTRTGIQELWFDFVC